MCSVRARLLDSARLRNENTFGVVLETVEHGVVSPVQILECEIVVNGQEIERTRVQKLGDQNSAARVL